MCKLLWKTSTNVCFLNANCHVRFYYSLDRRHFTIYSKYWLFCPETRINSGVIWSILLSLNKDKWTTSTAWIHNFCCPNPVATDNLQNFSRIICKLLRELSPEKHVWRLEWFSCAWYNSSKVLIQIDWRFSWRWESIIAKKWKPGN